MAWLTFHWLINQGNPHAGVSDVGSANSAAERVLSGRGTTGNEDRALVDVKHAIDAARANGYEIPADVNVSAIDAIDWGRISDMA